MLKFLLAVILFISPAFAMAQNLDAGLQASIVQDCTRTVNDYAWHLDHPDPDPRNSSQIFSELFTEDAELTMPDDVQAQNEFEGRKAMEDAYLDMIVYVQALYLSSNIRITPTSETTATGTSYLSFYMHGSSGSMNDDGAITGVFEMHDTYRIIDGGCLIASRNAKMRLSNLVGIIVPASDQ